jgi:hypothetical protein
MSKTGRKQSKMLRKQLALEKRLTKEQKIALNKAKVAQFHPEPDFSTGSPKMAIERQKIKHEKKMLEKAKKIWH